MHAIHSDSNLQIIFTFDQTSFDCHDWEVVIFSGPCRSASRDGISNHATKRRPRVSDDAHDDIARFVSTGSSVNPICLQTLRHAWGIFGIVNGRCGARSGPRWGVYATAKKRIMELSDESTYIEKRAPRRTAFAKKVYSRKPTTYHTEFIYHNGL